ncbi:hypothetical protein LCGC14_0370580 [marine sediment metagenome]|uniref:Uncharacterized protein n=1 Tax=marine sediment metagenome TaxID=412755 RepID=A0A0F9TN68_9ZZZZ|nr:hypothetical protein [Maribacter sp.]HDZ04892.1 hypothetical protein [Maribacter sp.]
MQTLSNLFMIGAAVAGGAVLDNSVQGLQQVDSLNVQGIVELLIGPFGALIAFVIIGWFLWKQNQKKDETIRKEREDKEQMYKDIIEELKRDKK